MSPDEMKAKLATIEKFLKSFPIPSNRTSIRPMYTPNGEYRGKRQHIVGYSWLRPGASRYRGVVNDAILGVGASFDEAMAVARKKAGSV